MNHPIQPGIKAVLFDWDMTLGAALGNISSVERTAALLRQVGLNYSIEAIESARTQRQARIEQGQLPGPLAPQTKDGLIVYYQQLLALLDHPQPSADLGEQVYNAYAHLPFVFYPDTLPTFRALVAQGVHLGIITNHSPAIRPVIEAELGVFVAPGAILISGEINLYKPEPAIFRQAAAQLQTPIGHCLYVGDNLEVDALGAVGAGYGLGLWCDRSAQPPPKNLPDGVHRITDLEQVIPYVVDGRQ
ncbi:MAG: HAD family hydrolase [Anaerolineae bacterium]|nr:HAD family hydrolase [Anaerolineae bacterium]